MIISEHILEEVARHYRGKFKATKPQAAAVGSFAGIDIVSPRAFYDRLRG